MQASTGLRLVRRYTLSSVRRGWREAIFGSAELSEPPTPATLTESETKIPDSSPPEYVKTLVETYLPQYTGHWEQAPLDNLEIKSKMLLSCEAHFQGSIPSTSLGSILTAGDLLKLVDLKSSSLPPPPPSPSLFPNVPLDSLPPNLSVQTHTAARPKEKRLPFQNFSSKTRHGRNGRR